MLQIPWRLNLVLALGVLAIYTAFYFGASLVDAHRLAPFTGLGAAFVMVTPTLWGLVHEGIHGRVMPLPEANRLGSRALCVLLGFSFDAVQFGHLMHHRYNGHEHDRPNRMKPGEPRWRSWSRHCTHLFGGHYVFTALVGAVAFAPARLREQLVRHALSSEQSDIVAMRRAALKWCSEPQRIFRIRVDFAASCLLTLFAFLHYAEAWPALLLGLYGRALLYSILDNLPHYGMGGRGNESALNLSAHPWVSIIILNHNLHRIHHERPHLPWRALAAHLPQTPMDGDYFAAAIRQFSGPTRT
ncbi:MAG TPA: fatty acid desaturase [Steroidobacteraceae bacterium]